MIYVAPGIGDDVTLVASRSDWDAVLARYPERARGERRAVIERIRTAVVAALATDGGVVRVTLDRDDARDVLGG